MDALSFEVTSYQFYFPVCWNRELSSQSLKNNLGDAVPFGRNLLRCSEALLKALQLTPLRP